jgi:hypothetical protein
MSFGEWPVSAKYNTPGRAACVSSASSTITAMLALRGDDEHIAGFDVAMNAFVTASG